MVLAIQFVRKPIIPLTETILSRPPSSNTLPNRTTCTVFRSKIKENRNRIVSRQGVNFNEKSPVERADGTHGLGACFGLGTAQDFFPKIRYDAIIEPSDSISSSCL